jgi:SulP family sulfate permease
MAALVAVMIMVSIGTFNWVSFRNLREHPRSSSVVMLATVAVTVYTHDLARGVLTGVLLSGFFFAHKIAQILLVRVKADDSDAARVYEIYGQVFFASADRFVDAFDFEAPAGKVRIDLTHASFWDITAVSALDKVVLKFRRRGTEVEVLGLNEASATLVDRFGVHDKDVADRILTGH